MSGDISYQQVHKSPVPPRDVNPILPQSVNDAILRCLSKNPDDRYADARLLMTDLVKALEDLGGCSKYGIQNATQVIDGPVPALEPSVSASSRESLADFDLDLN